MTLFWIILTLLPMLAVGSEEILTVDSPSGKFIGHLLKSRNSRDIIAFQGIPYALPPIGNLRFKDPVKYPKLEEIYEANDDSATCFQPSSNFTQTKNISSYFGVEDCLYLNVYKPKTHDGEGLLPVFAWVHAGGFIMGSGSSQLNGPKYLLDKDMILVTMNYRLGILGYMSTGDTVLPGNLGMKDQVLALKWIQENIASFGGDPDSVTLGGMSAGSASVSLHMHSPLSRGLFHRVIAESGTAHCEFATRTISKAKADARKVAKYLGCSDDSQQLLKCLQKMPMKELFKAAVLPFTPWYTELAMDFVPTIEEESQEAFLTQTSLNEPSTIPLITGVNSHECKYMITELILPIGKYHSNKTLLLENIAEYIDDVMPLWGFYRGHPREKEITKKIQKFYFGEREAEDANEVKVIDMFSDLVFVHGLRRTGKIEKGPTYLYKFSYKGSISLAGELEPEYPEGLVGHGDECLLIFDMEFVPKFESWSEKDIDMSKRMVDMWYNFIKTGNPTPESNLWKESDGGVNYLEFTNHGLEMKENMFQTRMEFLDQLNLDTSSISHYEL